MNTPFSFVKKDRDPITIDPVANFIKTHYVVQASDGLGNDFSIQTYCVKMLKNGGTLDIIVDPTLGGAIPASSQPQLIVSTSYDRQAIIDWYLSQGATTTNLSIHNNIEDLTTITLGEPLNEDKYVWVGIASQDLIGQPWQVSYTYVLDFIGNIHSPESLFVTESIKEGLKNGTYDNPYRLNNNQTDQQFTTMGGDCISGSYYYTWKKSGGQYMSITIEPLNGQRLGFVYSYDKDELKNYIISNGTNNILNGGYAETNGLPMTVVDASNVAADYYGIVFDPDNIGQNSCNSNQYFDVTTVSQSIFARPMGTYENPRIITNNVGIDIAASIQSGQGACEYGAYFYSFQLCNDTMFTIQGVPSDNQRLGFAYSRLKEDLQSFIRTHDYTFVSPTVQNMNRGYVEAVNNGDTITVNASGEYTYTYYGVVYDIDQFNVETCGGTDIHRLTTSQLNCPFGGGGGGWGTFPNPYILLGDFYDQDANFTVTRSFKEGECNQGRIWYSMAVNACLSPATVEFTDMPLYAMNLIHGKDKNFMALLADSINPDTGTVDLAYGGCVEQFDEEMNFIGVNCPYIGSFPSWPSYCFGGGCDYEVELLNLYDEYTTIYLPPVTQEYYFLLATGGFTDNSPDWYVGQDVCSTNENYNVAVNREECAMYADYSVSQLSNPIIIGNNTSNFIIRENIRSTANAMGLYFQTNLCANTEYTFRIDDIDGGYSDIVSHYLIVAGPDINQISSYIQGYYSNCGGESGCVPPFDITLFGGFVGTLHDDITDARLTFTPTIGGTYYIAIYRPYSIQVWVGEDEYGPIYNTVQLYGNIGYRKISVNTVQGCPDGVIAGSYDNPITLSRSNPQLPGSGNSSISLNAGRCDIEPIIYTQVNICAGAPTSVVATTESTNINNAQGIIASTSKQVVRNIYESILITGDFDQSSTGTISGHYYIYTPDVSSVDVLGNTYYQSNVDVPLFVDNKTLYVGFATIGSGIGDYKCSSNDTMNVFVNHDCPIINIGGTVSASGVENYNTDILDLGQYSVPKTISLLSGDQGEQKASFVYSPTLVIDDIKSYNVNQSPVCYGITASLITNDISGLSRLVDTKITNIADYQVKNNIAYIKPLFTNEFEFKDVQFYTSAIKVTFDTIFGSFTRIQPINAGDTFAGSRSQQLYVESQDNNIIRLVVPSTDEPVHSISGSPFGISSQIRYVGTNTIEISANQNFQAGQEINLPIRFASKFGTKNIKFKLRKPIVI